MRDRCATTKLLIGDSHQICLAGLSKLLADRFEIVDTVQDGCVLLARVLELQPDVIVTDVLTRFLSAEDAARQIKGAWADAKLVLLTDRRDAWEAHHSLDAGAAAYILKDDTPELLVAAICAVARGESGIMSLMLGTPAEPAETHKIGVLTPRQQQVLRLLAEGRSLKEIASIIDVSARTVEFHKYELMRRLAVRSNAELMALAARHGLIEVSEASEPLALDWEA